MITGANTRGKKLNHTAIDGTGLFSSNTYWQVKKDDKM